MSSQTETKHASSAWHRGARRRGLALGVLAVGLAAFLPVAYGDTPTVTFGAATNHSTGAGHASSVAIGDLNADGVPDLAVANTGRNRLRPPRNRRR